MSESKIIRAETGQYTLEGKELWFNRWQFLTANSLQQIDVFES